MQFALQFALQWNGGLSEDTTLADRRRGAPGVVATRAGLERLQPPRQGKGLVIVFVRLQERLDAASPPDRLGRSDRLGDDFLLSVKPGAVAYPLGAGSGQRPSTRNCSRRSVNTWLRPNEAKVTPSGRISRAQSWESNGLLANAPGVSTPTHGGSLGARAVEEAEGHVGGFFGLSLLAPLNQPVLGGPGMAQSLRPTSSPVALPHGCAAGLGR